GTACGRRSVTGDVGGGAWNAAVAGSAAPCTDSAGISVGAVSGEAGAVGGGSADGVEPTGTAAIVAGCWAVCTPAPARRLRVNGTTPPGLRSVTIRGVTGNRPTIPATARTLAVAVTPHHQRRWEFVGLYAVTAALAMGAVMGFCLAVKPRSSICVHSAFRTRGFPRAYRATCRMASG